MLHVLTHDILPVFSMLALGFVLGRLGKVSFDEARTVNRVAFIVLQPALIFPLMATLSIAQFELRTMALYALCQAVLFIIGYLVARHVFKRDHLEAWLLGMAVIFVNSLLYILPISVLIYGEGGATLPITAIVAWDTAFSFAFFIITTDVMAGGTSAIASAKRVALNPVLLAIVIGIAVNVSGMGVPTPLLTAMHFAGPAAAPLTLFALGVILSGHSVIPSPTVAGISALKLIGFPALVFGTLSVFPTQSDQWHTLYVLGAAGPSGAMAFSLAMIHGIRTDAIAPVIIWTSILSLFSLAVLA
ncbi:AEC family transporter [Celeribacter marinus]|uniref:AEC family transporter n=1 Tax=Celeribacter marinus TaxID=1397108 RepID=UPI00316B591B